MLNKLQLRNFQNHELTRIKLDPQITTITGPSDSGKSAVIRALRWLFLNKPGGDAFIKDGEKQCSVTIQLDDKKLTRSKGKENKYKLDGAEFVAFGTSVPETIQQFLNVDELNIQSQHDPPFWFSLSPGEVAKRINQIIDLSVIDRTLAETSKRIRTAKIEMNLIEARVKQAEQQLEELIDVPRQQAAFESLEQLSEELESLHARRNRLQELQQQGRQEERSAERVQKQLQSLVGVLKVGLKLEQSTEQQKRIKNLIGSANSELKWLQKSTGDLSSLEAKKQRVEQLERDQEQLLSLLEEAEEISEKLVKTTEEISEVRTRIEAETGGICPACGNEL